MEHNFDDALKHIKRHFGFLFGKRAKVIFSDFPNAFDNFVIGLETPDFHVQFAQDRSSITIQVGPYQAIKSWSDELWFDLIAIVMYLTQNKFLIISYWKHVLHEKDDEHVNKQLKQLSRIFEYYQDEIVDLFKPEHFLHLKDRLKAVQRETRSLIYEPRRSNERQKLEEDAEPFWQLINKGKA